MLWYKSWLETRLRILLLMAVIVFILSQVHLHNSSRMKPVPFLATLEFIWMVVPITLAGSGVRTDSPFRAVKGIQGSRHFTLSLPVSRTNLLASRIFFGLLSVAAVVAIGCLAASLFPEVRNRISLPDALSYFLTVFLCGFATFGVATLLATFLDQQWQGFAAMFVVFVVRWVFEVNVPSSRFDFFRAMGNGSPLVTHTLPWTPILTSVAIGMVCLAAAFRIEKARQY